MTKALFIFISLFVSLLSFGQTTVIGFAPEFIGKEANIYLVDDFITNKRKQVGTGIVEAKDSSFHISFENKEINKAVVEIGNIVGYLYVDQGKTYEVIFRPVSKDPKRLTENVIVLSFLNLPEDDINYKILAFDMWVDDFLFKHYYKSHVNAGSVKSDSLTDERARTDFFSELDTFKIYVDDYYRDEQNVFFLNYIKYSVAQLDNLHHKKMTNNEGIKRFETYLKDVPIHYNNEKFMNYFKFFFSEYFSTLPHSNEEDIIRAIHKQSPRELWKALAFDYRLTNPQHKELVMILALGESYYSMPYEQNDIIIIMDSLTQISRVPQNKIICQNILNEITSLMPGYPAPVIALNDGGKEPKAWINYEGYHIYVSFFETWCTECIKEMRIIKSMSEKYEGAVKFVSICTDSDPENFAKFRKNHPEFDWDFYHVSGNKNEVLSKFKVKDLPAYFLLDQDGFIVQAPAQSPVPDGEYETIEKTFDEIIKALKYRNE
ncbi:MAG: TlpA family protein disulfide reductase [Crocinitomicaceae bacterium]|nr:TlpA family protein disulfide reductase [Crocinitomicaceae bacterium]